MSQHPTQHAHFLFLSCIQASPRRVHKEAVIIAWTIIVLVVIGRQIQLRH